MTGELLFAPVITGLALGFGAAVIAVGYVIWWAITERRRHEESHAE